MNISTLYYKEEDKKPIFRITVEKIISENESNFRVQSVCLSTGGAYTNNGDCDFEVTISLINKRTVIYSSKIGEIYTNTWSIHDLWELFDYLASVLDKIFVCHKKSITNISNILSNKPDKE